MHWLARYARGATGVVTSSAQSLYGVAVSFDLYIWHENEPITAAEARAKLERWSDNEDAVFAAHHSVGLFYDALVDRFPPLESFSDEDIDRLGVWSMTPERSNAIVAASCVWSRADEVGTAIMTLAVEHGLVCYEPGYAVVETERARLRRALHIVVAELSHDARSRSSPPGMDHGSGGHQQQQRGP